MILWTETSGNNCFKAQLTKVGNFEIPGTHHYGTNTSFTLFQIAVPEKCKLMLPQLFLT